uniref:Uncharacterized protein n=1 Tax=Nothobranchius kadleci TaxID=1051664 RepID=A0A1A8C155_NOTKA
MEQQKVLQQKFTDLESRSRRNNIRIFGVPEGVKGDSLQLFLKEFLQRKLQLLQDMELNIQRAHRSRPQTTTR